MSSQQFPWSRQDIALESLQPRSLKSLNVYLQTLIRTRLWLQVLVGMALGIGVGIVLGPSVGWLAPQTAGDHPGVREACVIGVAHTEFGERPLALVTLHYENSANIDESLRQHLRDHLEKWMVPDVEVVDEIEKTTVGKFNKLALRERYQHYYQHLN